MLVAIPERLAVDETARVAALLTDTGIAIGALIVNRELPEGLPGEFFEARKAQERKYVAEIIQRFTRVPTLHIPQLPRDVYGLAALGLISQHLAV